MTDWAVAIIGALGRLLIALSDCERPGLQIRERAVEITDDLNNFAYDLEHDKDN